MKMLSLNKRTMTLVAMLILLLLAFAYVATSSGPLATVQVTVSQVKNQAISPNLFGIGIIEARYSYRIGPTMTGHVLQLSSHVGDQVTTGQVLGDMDPVDLETKIVAKDAAIKRARASVIAAEASVADTNAREKYAETQSKRYAELVKARTVSEEAADAKHQEHQIATASLAAARANLNAAREELEMLKAERDGLIQQRSNLRLVSPVNGLVVGRYIEPGSTVVAGQTVLEVIDPASLWVNVRFDQLRSRGLSPGLSATVMLRSQTGQPISGHVARVEPLADSVTEEFLAKVVFDQPFDTLPAVGELAEVNVVLPPLAATPVVPNASIKRINGDTGVWTVNNDSLDYVPVEIGATDLDGRVQILRGLQAGDSIVVYSTQGLTARSRVKVVDQLVGQ